LLGSSIPRLSDLINSYRVARGQYGHNPASGVVTVVVHAYVDEDLAAAKVKVREPLLQYLAEHVAQSGGMSELGGSREELQSREAQLIGFAFEKRFRDSLIGPKQKCRSLLDKLCDVGVNEVACLVDFGLRIEDVLAGIHRLAEIRSEYSAL
jgi:hypothetical protein